MTIDEAITALRKCLETNSFDIRIAEKLIYWLTEYRAMISGRESDSLSERLASHLVWAESNSYECPITLAEDLQEAISGIRDKDATICNLIENIKCLQSVSSWIPCSERMPETTEKGLGVLYSDCLLVVSSKTGWTAMAYCLTDGEKSWWEFADAQNKIKIDWDEVTHWMPLPEPPEKQKPPAVS